MVTMKFLYNECLQVCFSECLFILFSTWKIFWFGLDNVMWNKSLNEINLRCLLQGAFTSCLDGKRAASVGHKVCWNLIRCASHMSYFHCPQSRVCTGDVWAGSGWMDILWGVFPLFVSLLYKLVTSPLFWEMLGAEETLRSSVGDESGSHEACLTCLPVFTK